MAKKRRRYSREFKLEAVRLVDPREAAGERGGRAVGSQSEHAPSLAAGVGSALGRWRYTSLSVAS